jgi:hypothetical protein
MTRTIREARVWKLLAAKLTFGFVNYHPVRFGNFEPSLEARLESCFSYANTTRRKFEDVVRKGRLRPEIFLYLRQSPSKCGRGIEIGSFV